MIDSISVIDVRHSKLIALLATRRSLVAGIVAGASDPDETRERVRLLTIIINDLAAELLPDSAALNRLEHQIVNITQDLQNLSLECN